jgi:hypothetical protein
MHAGFQVRCIVRGAQFSFMSSLPMIAALCIHVK